MLGRVLRRILYITGQLGVMSLVRFFVMWILFFAAWRASDDIQLLGAALNTKIQASPTLFSASLVGLVFFLFRIFDGVTDPAAGIVSDAWVRRRRQRRNLLWFALLVPSAGLLLIFWPHHEMSLALRWTLLVAGMFIFFIGYTFYAIPYWSLIKEYSGGNPNETRVLSSLLGAGLLGATAIGAIISPPIVASRGFAFGAVVFAIPAVLFMIGPWFARPRQVTAPEPPEDDRPPMGRLFLRALKHRRFLAVLCIYAGSQMSFSVMTSAAPFITSRLLGGTEGDVTLIMAPFLGTAFGAFIFVPRLSRKYGWQKTVAVATVALAVVYTTTATLGQSWFGLSRMGTAMLVFACGGPMAAFILGLEGEAITACADERASEAQGIYWGVFNLVIKGVNGLAAFLTGILIDLSRPGVWGNTAVRAMGILAGLLLLVGLVAYAVLRRTSSSQNG